MVKTFQLVWLLNIQEHNNLLENLNHDEYKQIRETIEDNNVKSDEGPDKHEELHPGHRSGTLLP